LDRKNRVHERGKSQRELKVDCSLRNAVMGAGNRTLNCRSDAFHRDRDKIQSNVPYDRRKKTQHEEYLRDSKKRQMPKQNELF